MTGYQAVACISMQQVAAFFATFGTFPRFWQVGRLASVNVRRTSATIKASAGQSFTGHSSENLDFSVTMQRIVKQGICHFEYFNNQLFYFAHRF